MEPTAEQDAIRHSNAKTLKVSAGAGTGKTSTLVLYAQANPNKNMIYLAYNRAIKEEAQRKFPKNVRCVTTHGLAYASHGRPYQHKLGNPKPYQLSQALGLSARDAAIVLNVVTNFLTSAAREIDVDHTRGEKIPDGQRDQVVEVANKAWAMMCDTDNSVVLMPHDGYLKLFQVSNPVIRTETILFDEAQDSNPVTLAIVIAQKCNKVFVGDSRQSIYSFRGAVNAMDIIDADEHLRLTTSFRYGSGVAKLANAILGAYEPHPHPLRGQGKYETRFAVDRNKPHAVISRTNAMLFDEAVRALKIGIPFGFVGGVENYKFDTVLDAYRLFADQRGMINDKMIQSFATYADMVQYGEELDDKEVKSLVKIVTQYEHEIPTLVERIKNEAVAALTGNEIVMTTGHKAKGLEFMDVFLTDDFTTMQAEQDDEGNEIPPDREEVNLLYVACTRALRGLQVHESMMPWLKEANRGLYFTMKAHQREMTSAANALLDAVVTTARENKTLMESMGVVVGDYDENHQSYQVKANESALAKLMEFPADFKVVLDNDEVAQGDLSAGAGISKPGDVAPAPDVSKPLFDSEGYEHSLVASNGVEIVTKIGAVYALWNAKTGECLKVNCDGLTLGNTPMSEAERNRRRDLGAKMLADLHAEAAATRAAASSSVESYML